MYPRSQNACTSPNAWITKIFTANAVARTAGNETLARAVFEGPVFKNKKKIAKNIAIPETQKYEPGKRGRNLSATIPPKSVDTRPATTVIKPKIVIPTSEL